MRKLAVFVEGSTEVVFVEKLVEEIAGQANVLIEHREIRGGTNARRSFALVRAAKPDPAQKYFVLIVDCGGDRQVKTRILEEHENLTRQGYEKILGLRDVRPEFTRAEVPRLEAGLRLYVRPSLIPVEFILAILEVEAWFLAETTHFPRIDAAVTVEAIRAQLGFDPENDDLEGRLNPAADLHACYALGGKAYQKHQARDTVEALDFAHVYLNVRGRFPYLERLIASVEQFPAS